MLDVSHWGLDRGWLGFCSLYFHIKDVSYWWSLTHMIPQQHDQYGTAFIRHTYRCGVNRRIDTRIQMQWTTLFLFHRLISQVSRIRCRLYCLQKKSPPPPSFYFLPVQDCFFFQTHSLYDSLSTFPLDIHSIKVSHSNKNYLLCLLLWVNFQTCAVWAASVFSPHRLDTEQGAQVMGLKVKHRTAFARPSCLSVSALLLQLSSEMCTSCAPNLANTEQHYHSKALGGGGGLQIWMLPKTSVKCLLDFMLMIRLEHLI